MGTAMKWKIVRCPRRLPDLTNYMMASAFATRSSGAWTAMIPSNTEVRPRDDVIRLHLL